MSDHNAMEEAIRKARRVLDVDDVVNAAEKNGGHIAFGSGNPTLGEFATWLFESSDRDRWFQELTTHGVYVLWKDFLAGRAH